MKSNVLIKIFEHFEEAVLSVNFVVMTAICFVQVVTRYIFHYSMPWSEEALRALFVWSSCLGISLGFRTKSHLGVDALVNLFHGKFKKALAIIAYVIVLAFCVVIIYYSAKVTGKQFTTKQKTIAMGLPIAYISVSLIVGFALTIVRIIQVMAAEFSHKDDNDSGHISEGLL